MISEIPWYGFGVKVKVGMIAADTLVRIGHIHSLKCIPVPVAGCMGKPAVLMAIDRFTYLPGINGMNSTTHMSPIEPREEQPRHL